MVCSFIGKSSHSVVSVTCMCAGLSLVVGLVLYISSINDEVMNRPREPEQFFHYRYGWSFAFAASSFLLKEVFARAQTCTHADLRSVCAGLVVILTQ